ncbi:MAG: hypothetical protein RIM84_08115 [Alphaproteobacteria bacterium]
MRQEQDERVELALDRLLDAYDAPEPDPGLATRIIASMPRPGPAWWPFGALWQPLSGLAAAALIGIVVGVALPSPSVADPDDAAPWNVAELSEPSL